MEKNLKKKAGQLAKDGISFAKAFLEIANRLPQRSQDIIKGRYGIADGKNKTLEEIGAMHGITRERVRQVTREVFRKAKEQENDPLMQEVRKNICFAINEHSGIIETKKLVENLGHANPSEEGCVRFFVDCAHDMTPVEIKGETVKASATSDFDLARWRMVKNAAIEALALHGEPMEEESLFAELSKTGTLKEIRKKVIFDYLAVSEEIKKNSFAKWGLTKWKEITPKGTREKSFLILKEAGKPLHFREIAKRIDKYKLTKKKAHPQTVHNELIKDKKFILVGRGIYALAEWGYEKGTVKDVIEKLLEKEKKALSKEEILNGVLKVRQVKKTTIIINLNNFFIKNAQGKYELKRKQKKV